MSNTTYDTETTYLDEIGIYSCNNCGACASSINAIKHYTTCKKGEAKKWENFYEKNNDG